MENGQKIAYLRSLPRKEQCVLTFDFNYRHVQEEIKSVRKVRDSIESLVEHTKNKIQKLLNKDGKENINVKDIRVSITSNGTPKDNFSCWDFIHKANDVVLTVFEQTYKVIINAPLVEEILLPKFIYVNNVIIPLKVKCIHALDWMCKFEWFRSKDLETWEKVGIEYTYKPRYEDENHFLKLTCKPKNKKCEGPTYEKVTEFRVKELSLPAKCPFEERHKDTTYKLDGKRFRVVTYNILSERYTNDGFPYCAPEFLALEYRKHLLRNELLGYNADIICLQEVDLKILQPFLGKQLMREGFVGIFYKKGNRISEGLATFYREDRFKVLETKHYVLADELRSSQIFRNFWQAIQKNKDVKDKFMKQATSLQITVLEEKLGETFIVANTHLYYYWEDNHIRLLQIGMVMKLIENIYKEWFKKAKLKRQNLPVIFCGDFNSKPESGVYEFMTLGTLSEKHPEWRIGKKPIENLRLEHPFNLHSAYGTPKITNYVDDFKGCLDYIFFDTSRCILEKISPLPSEEILGQNVALPSEVFPSDHLALVADFKLT